MKNIKRPEIRYNSRVRSVLNKDYKMGFLHSNCGEFALMCKEMLACMLTYFPKIHYVQIQESDKNTGVWYQEFSSDTEEYSAEEKQEQFLNYFNGWHVVNINCKEFESFRKKIFEIVSNDLLYEGTILEKYRDQSRELGNVLFQYGLMHVFYHEYGHAMDGHILAKKHGKIRGSNLELRALEYNADIFAVNQMIKRFMYDNYSEVYIAANKVKLNIIVDEIALMALGCYIFLDCYYDRSGGSYVAELMEDMDHMKPYLRQYCNLEQFAGILDKHIQLNEEDRQYIADTILHHIEAYEKMYHETQLKEAPFWVGALTTIGKLKQSEVQECWNFLCDTMQEYISPFVEIGKYDVLNVVTGKYEKWYESK